MLSMVFFSYDLVWKIVSYFGKSESPNDVLRLRRVDRHWYTVITRFHWRRLIISSDQRGVDLVDYFLKHFTAPPTSLYPFPILPKDVNRLRINATRIQTADDVTIHIVLFDRLRQLLKLVDVHTLVIDGATGLSVHDFGHGKWQQHTVDLLDALPSLKHFTYINDHPNPYPDDAFTYPKQLFVKVLAKGWLTTFHVDWMAPLEEPWALHAPLKAQPFLQELTCGFLYGDDWKCIMDVVADANLVHLKRLRIVSNGQSSFVDPEPYHQMQPNNPICEERFYSSMHRMQNACKRLERLEIETLWRLDEMHLDAVVFFANVSRFPALKVLTVPSELFYAYVPQDDSELPYQAEILVPTVQYLTVLGGRMPLLLMHAMAGMFWPSLRYFDHTHHGSWSHYGAQLLDHAPHLTRFAIALDADEEKQRAQITTLTATQHPSMRELNLVEDWEYLVTLDDEDVIESLRKAFPYARLHLQSSYGCHMYYGTHATLTGQIMDDEHDDCPPC
jgi:hypothetical protein